VSDDRIVDPAEALSQQEVAALLSAVHSGQVKVSPGRRPDAAQGERYNFRRPSRVSKEQIRALGVLHEELAKVASASLSGMLRTMVDLELETVEQIAYNEYVLAIATPTCAFVFNMEPLKGAAVLELNPHVAFLMIDRLLGGQGQGTPSPRDLTEIERAVVDRVGQRAMVDLQQAWQDVGTYVFRVLNLETNPQFIQATSPTEVIVVATFRIRIGETTGGMTIGYPYPLLEPVIGRLGTQQRWATAAAAAPRPEAREFLVRELTQSALGVRAFLGQARLTVRDLLALRPGQVIRVDAAPRHPVRVDINRVPKFVGRPGTHRAHLAVEVLGPVTERSLPA
jgi:flagellar motor switch protein FliM